MKSETNSFKTNNLGWKAHVAMNDNNEDNLARGWNHVLDILIDERIQGKIVKPNNEFFRDPIQCGKQLTIYCCADMSKDWEKILYSIENALINANVEACLPPPGNKQINGSQFISYRNDENNEGNYISAEKTKGSLSYN